MKNFALDLDQLWALRSALDRLEDQWSAKGKPCALYAIRSKLYLVTDRWDVCHWICLDPVVNWSFRIPDDQKFITDLVRVLFQLPRYYGLWGTYEVVKNFYVERGKTEYVHEK